MKPSWQASLLACIAVPCLLSALWISLAYTSPHPHDWHHRQGLSQSTCKKQPGQMSIGVCPNRMPEHVAKQIARQQLLFGLPIMIGAAGLLIIRLLSGLHKR
jgi:hypothetical protein